MRYYSGSLVDLSSLDAAAAAAYATDIDDVLNKKVDSVETATTGHSNKTK